MAGQKSGFLTFCQQSKQSLDAAASARRLLVFTIEVLMFA
jgi:hypothetical protein